MLNIIKEFSILKKEQITCFLFLIINIVFVIMTPSVLKQIIDLGIENRSKGILIKGVIVYILLIIFQYGFDFGANHNRVKLKSKYLIKKREEIYNRINNLSGNMISKYDVGKIVNIIVEDIEQVATSFTTILYDLSKNIIIAILAVIFLVKLNHRLFFIIMILHIFILIVNNRISYNIQKKTKEFITLKDENKHILLEYLRNIESVILANEYKYYSNRLIKKERIKQDKFLNLMNLVFLNKLSGAIISSVSQIIIWFIGGLLVINSAFTFGELIAFMSYSSLLVKPILDLTNINYEFRRTIVSLERINEFKNDIVLKSEISPNRFSIETIEYKDVSFYYHNSGVVLKNINLIFERGKTYGIFGESGCGKSTLIKLLLKLWNPKEGEIKINNIDINDLDKDIIRGKIAYLPQENIIPKVSIRSYLTMDNEISNEKIYQALLDVNMYNKIYELDKKLDSIIDEDFSMSVGEKQRLSLAKALLRGKEVLILDEFTSNLDKENEMEVTRNILDNMEGKIVIVITHCTDILGYFDVIYKNECEKYKAI